MTNPPPSLSLENGIQWFLLISFQEVAIGNSISSEKTRIILRKQVVWKVLSLLRSFAVILQHPAPYNSSGTDVAFVYPELGCAAVGIGFPHRLQPCESRSCFPQACCNVLFRLTTYAYHAYIIVLLYIQESKLIRGNLTSLRKSLLSPSTSPSTY